MTDQGAMDPGPVRVFQIVLTLTARQLTSVSPEGAPLYGDPTTDQRAVRLSHADELVVPVALGDEGARKILGPEVLIRVRRGHTAMAYGAFMVTGAPPDSEIRVDGGPVARASSDGTALLTGIPVGARDVRLRDAEGRSVARIVTVVPQRTVVASATHAPAAIGMTPSGKNSQGAAEFQRRRDGAPMVQIPGGEFVMGNLATEGAPLPHTVNVSRFLIDKLPVTRGRFTQFAAATGRPLPPQPYWVIDDTHPVVFVTWDEARAYCEWAGARLPTEAEREKAARGTDGRLFPWGSEEPSPERAVFRRNWGYEGTAAVGMRPTGASPYGVLDAGGNVWEWCEDWYDPDYYKTSPTQDPLGPRTGRAHIVRGGSWDSRPTVLSSSSRNWGYVGYREGDFGFRCAADLPR
jgi:formylglycine-generating enzyme required for sulfatase activity